MTQLEPEAAAARAAYDRFPYTSHPYPQTQPARLAAAARIFGLRPPDPASARVLEIGCGRGGNLIPLAELYPAGDYTGVDVSGEQIAEARAVAGRLALGNIRFDALDLAALPAEYGDFDYIIAHGVYSWIAPATRTALLRLCAERLRPDGVAYVSYNAYPGWHLKNIARELMQLRTAGISAPAEQVRTAREIVDRFGAGVDGAYGAVLRAEYATFAGRDDAYVMHEQLERHNHPEYFIEFVAAAAEAKLVYLGEADPTANILDAFEPALAARLRELGRDHQIATEQYLDFLVGRQFRESLLVHADAAENIDRAVGAERMSELWFLPRSPMSRVVLRRGESVATLRGGYARFANEQDELAAGSPVAEAALDAIERMAYSRPAAFSATDLAGFACGGSTEPAVRTQILDLLLELFRRKMIRPFAAPVPAGPIGPTPRLRASSLDDAATGRGHTANFAHERITLVDDEIRRFMVLLDGTRTIPELEQATHRMYRDGLIGVAGDPGADAREQARAHVASRLETFARLRLLV